jgi:intraflagellar transport protein 74
MALHMAEKNRQVGQDLDRIFMQRKQRETDTAQIEEQIEGIHRSIQKRLNEMEPGKLRAYNELMMKQKDLQDRLSQSEHRLGDINHAIRSYESDEKNNSLRKEYLSLEKKYQSLKKDSESLQEELEIANLDPKEAHNKFVARVNNFKQGAKALEDKISSLRDEISNNRKNLEELNNSSLTNNEADQEDAAKYELLVKRDQDMTAFIDSFDETRNNILQEQRGVQYMIVALLEHIGKGLEDSTNMPTPEAMNEMENAKQFKEKNLMTAQKTMESLMSEKKKREKELEMLKSSEPKLLNELNNLRENMGKMRIEMEELSDLDKIRKDFNDIKLHLQELKTSYIKRRDTMRQQIQSVSLEHEALKKSLNANEISRELDDIEKRLKHGERNIFDLKEFVEVKSRETDFEHIKTMCLKLANTLNDMNVKSTSQNPSASYYNAQAKW